MSVVELFEFDGGEVIDAPVCAVGVEPLDPAGGCGFNLIDVSPP
ncbi:hypothetical protein M4I32_14355 [Microbacterium sp. LRZ72]|nr:hypothetical protein [Microbacterium sp. LRZ72]MDX2377976.1 hypothetical protein [Microbacterium sp. LRZ72]